MTSNVTPLSGLSARRGIHLISVLLVTLAFVVGGGAVLAAVRALTWDVAATVEPADPPGASAEPSIEVVEIQPKIRETAP